MGIDDNTNCDLEKGFNNGDDEVEGGKDNDNKKNDCDDNIGEQLNNADGGGIFDFEKDEEMQNQGGDEINDKEKEEEEVKEEIEEDDEEEEEEDDKNDAENVNDSLDDETMNSLLTNSLRKSLSDRNVEVREAAHRLLRNRMIEVDKSSDGSASASSSINSGNKSVGSDPNSLGMASA